MKKIFYTCAAIAAFLFTSCTEDKGTSFEVADANHDERVNPNHLRDYYRPGTASLSTTSTEIGANTNSSGGQADAGAAAGTGANQSSPTAVDLVYAYYTKNNPVEYYHFSASQHMGGLANDAMEENTSNTADSMYATSRNNGNNNGNANSNSNNGNTAGGSNSGNGNNSGGNNNSGDNSNATNTVSPGSTTADMQPSKTSKTNAKKGTDKKKKERLTPYQDN